MLGQRKVTRELLVGGIGIGGSYPIAIQSMNSTDTRNVEATLAQIAALAEAGCEITRVAVPDREAALALADITKRSVLPVVADIHFDYRLALLAIESGAAKIRINPGNLGGEDRIRQVAEAAKTRKIPIRVGVNGGSISQALIDRYGGVNRLSMVESAVQAVSALEKCDFHDIVVSVKSSDVPLSLEVYRLLSERVSYPLHIGITESGTVAEGAVRSAVGIGALLAQGIGDTLRVSLTGDPVEEVRVALQILRALEFREQGVRIVSCPTCGRTQVPLIALAEQVEKATAQLPYNMRVAVMGCVVNGPGEARESDVGIAGGKDQFVLFRKGEKVRTVPADRVLEELLAEIHEIGRGVKNVNLAH